MQVQPINHNNNTNFGMAFYMPEYSKMSKKIGKYLADEAEKARPELEKMAKDVNIAVFPVNSDNISYKGFHVFIAKIEEIIKNPIKRFFHRPPYVDAYVRNYHAVCHRDSMENTLIKKIFELKQDFIKCGGNLD